MKKRELRKTRRFKVENSFPLKVCIPQSNARAYSLRTLSEGGFGCLIPFRDAGIVQHPEIDIRFTFGDRTLSFKGTVQYCTFLPKQGSSYLGVKFAEIDPRQELVLKTIIQAALKKGHLTNEAIPAEAEAS